MTRPQVAGSSWRRKYQLWRPHSVLSIQRTTNRANGMRPKSVRRWQVKRCSLRFRNPVAILHRKSLYLSIAAADVVRQHLGRVVRGRGRNMLGSSCRGPHRAVWVSWPQRHGAFENSSIALCSNDLHQLQRPHGTDRPRCIERARCGTEEKKPREFGVTSHGSPA